jgi:hypothetical protein
MRKQEAIKALSEILEVADDIVAMAVGDDCPWCSETSASGYGHAIQGGQGAKGLK